MADHDAINNVRRKINEVMKKTDERIVVGWRPALTEVRKDGDVWEGLDGRKWTMKNGIKQTVTKLDLAKTPWFCPVCNQAMGHRLDTKFWMMQGKCMDCIIKEETEIRRQGKWEEYEKKKLQQNYVASLKDHINQLQDYHDTVSSPSFVHADNERILMIENWEVNIEKIKQDLRTDIAELTTHLAECEAEMIKNGTSN
jgi:ribosomal protein L33